MGDKLFSREDVRASLHNTICMYQNVPVIVQTAGDDPESIVRVQRLGKAERWRKIDYTIEDFSYSSVPLGYINVLQAYYLYRIPCRTTKQGLSLEVVRSSPMMTEPQKRDALYSQALENTILNKYPTKEEAYRKLYEGALSVAVHRYFAIERLDRNLFVLRHRGKILATKYSESGQWLFPPSTEESVVRWMIAREAL